MISNAKSKGQVGMEFLIIAGIIVLILIGIIAFYSERRREIDKMQTTLDSISECTKISNFITKAYVIGDGIRIDTSTPYFVIINNSQIDMKNGQTGKIESSCTFYGLSEEYQTTGQFIIKNDKNIVTFTNSTA